MAVSMPVMLVKVFRAKPVVGSSETSVRKHLPF